MAEDWAIDVRKYAPDADEAVIAGIVKYCGVALRSRDSSLVAFSDPAETALVRENYCRKKLGLTQSDEHIDAAVASVGERMKDDRTRNRVTVYYLLAEMFGKLGIFGATASAATPAAATPVEQAPLAAATLPVGTAAQTPQSDRDDGGIFGTAFATLGIVGAIFLVTATLGSLIGNRAAPVPELPAGPETAPAAAVATPTAAAAIPEGSGVVAQDVAGKPQLSVYFDTGSAVVSPDFATATGAIKAWIASNPGTRLAVSGFNDPTGNAALNAELSKKRAQSVAAALAAQGVPADSIDLEKPPETTDTTTTKENARRVDIVIKEGS